MTETLAYGYSYESTQRELSNEYQDDRVLDGFQKYLHLCALDERSLSIGRVRVSGKHPHSDLASSVSGYHYRCQE